ncbi:unnamed protein product [Dovyalis caffra]|uniref:F-box domain-containing protein n=1 Tax=Dovyalis caffra TaxID=77055 RepID=A0AAV1RYC8_9ROSI|nr:unnamed protein product [Dovyalis caffra]
MENYNIFLALLCSSAVLIFFFDLLCNFRIYHRERGCLIRYVRAFSRTAGDMMPTLLILWQARDGMVDWLYRGFCHVIFPMLKIAFLVVAVVNGTIVLYRSLRNSFLWDPLVGTFITQQSRMADTEHVSNDVLIEILSWLPADCILDCQRVCRKWQALTSTPSFAELQLKRAAPGILASYMSFAKESYCLYIDEGHRSKANNQTLMHLMRLVDYTLIPPPGVEFFICNPFTQQRITLGTPPRNAFICGFFFHTMEGDYRVLSVFEDPECYRYLMFSLQTRCWRLLPSSSYCHPFSTSPIVVDGNLHWMVYHRRPSLLFQHCQPKSRDFVDLPCRNSILRFNMLTEEFDSMAHPQCDCCLQRSDDFLNLDMQEMHLIKMDEALSLCHVQHGLIDIWLLEDYSNWLWVQRYKVNLKWDIKYDPFYRNGFIHLVSFQNGELLLDWKRRGGLFGYSLELNTVRKINMKEIEEESFNFISHTPSLVSLRKVQ